MRSKLAAVAIALVFVVPAGARAESACSVTVCADVTLDDLGTTCGSGPPGFLSCQIVVNGAASAESRYGADPVWTPGQLEIETSILSCSWIRLDESGDCFRFAIRSWNSAAWGGPLLTRGATAAVTASSAWFDVPHELGPCTTVVYEVRVRVSARTAVSGAGAAISEGVERIIEEVRSIRICSD